MTDVEIVCGPHPRKRRGSEFATVARATVIRADVPGALVELHGVVEQRAYLSAGAEVWDEYVGPIYADLAGAFDRRRFDDRWAVAQEPLNELDGLEVAVRERAVLRCPVCREALPVGDADELRDVLDKLSAGDAGSVTLGGLRRARDLNKREGAGTVM